MKLAFSFLVACLCLGLSSAFLGENLRALHAGHSHRRNRARLVKDLAQLSRDEDDLEVLVSLLLRRWGVLGKIAREQPVTIFAPTDDAFENISMAPFRYYYNADVLDDVLKYHVLPDAFTAQQFIDAGTQSLETLSGETLTVKPEGGKVLLESNAPNAAEVTDADFELSDGSIVHFISAVLIPPGFPVDNFATLAQAAGLTELLNALDIAGLSSYAEALTTKGLTLFAPSNEAFEKAAEENGIEKEGGEAFFTDALLRELGADAFEEVLKNHLANSLLDSKDLKAKASYRCSRWSFFHWWCNFYKRVVTLSGLKLNFREENNGDLLVLFGENFSKSSKVVVADQRTLIGIAHVIDTVIIP